MSNNKQSIINKSNTFKTRNRKICYYILILFTNVCYINCNAIFLIGLCILLYLSPYKYDCVGFLFQWRYDNLPMLVYSQLFFKTMNLIYIVIYNQDSIKSKLVRRHLDCFTKSKSHPLPKDPWQLNLEKRSTEHGKA